MKKSSAEPPYPLRHLSVRVPWHDSGWDGRVCANPAANTSCLILKNIGMQRDDSREMANRGKSLEVLQENEHPCCSSERGFFMAPFPLTRTKEHPYAESSPATHGHFLATPLRHPGYCADAIPFQWMLKENMEGLRDRYQLDIDTGREPEMAFGTDWVQQRDNHAALLDCFFGHVRAEESLCFFYAKRTPLSEDPRRVIIGVGTVRHISGNQEYRYKVPEQEAPLRSLLWERLVQHSIRPHPKDGFIDGFLLPYHQALEYAGENPEFDPSSIVAFAPADRQLEFSYVCEHVTHDAAIGALLSCAASLREASRHLKGPWDRYQAWIDAELGRLWKLRGPCPGLGAALTAFGIGLGVFVAYDLSRHLGANDDPWPVVDRMFRNPASLLSADAARQVGKEHQQLWKGLAAERKTLLKLLSRFEVSPEQAGKVYVQEERANLGLAVTDAELIANPYRLYEVTRTTALPVSFATVDRGVFSDPVVRDRHPLPEPTLVTTGTDVRRVRALVVKALEEAGAKGDTLLPRADVVSSIRDLEIRPDCPVTGDLMAIAESSFAPEVEKAVLGGGGEAFQLTRLAVCSRLIRQEVKKRRDGKPHVLSADWPRLLADALGPVKSGDEREKRSRDEKIAALKVLAESRLSILIGPAGTGKTTLLAVLCSQETIAAGGILLLAPTGKARVRMEQAARKKKIDVTGKTIAGYLLDCGRYDSETGRYLMLGPSAPKGKAANTVIIDEMSMMTEEMLAATLEAVGGAKRIILVGDHRQLPPIGAGRAFADLVRYLQPDKVETLFPKFGKCYAELTVNWRQDANAPDARLAAWFGGTDPGPGEEGIFAELRSYGPNDRLQVKSWKTPEECQQAVLAVLQSELRLSGPDDLIGFDQSLGGTLSGQYCYFNTTWEKDGKTQGVNEAAEDWQILSPVRDFPHGVAGLNRLIHRVFRARSVELARSRYRKTPKPIGPELIVYGDKVICVRNHRRWDMYPKENGAQYVANGEIGIAVGQFKGPETGGKVPWKLNVEFTSQPKFKYGFKDGDFNDEGDPPLELAYALTVHKAQGSEFGTVILVLPNPCRLLSRELLYTALTRQKKRIVILYQGEPADLRSFTGAERSETARRLTNLFTDPEPVVVKEKRYDNKHIHRSLRGEMMMSKSEVLIANELHRRSIDYAYEKDLTLGGRTCKPDFTIEDPASGLTVYWEHCGMLLDDEYRRRWERKKQWYRDHGILSWQDSGGPEGTLVETSDDPATGFDCQVIASIADGLFGKV